MPQAAAAEHPEPETKHLSTVQNGLSRPGKEQRVVVIGAGMAGLTAAYELQDAGHSVTVLEAQNRVGGRIQTLRAPFTDGLYAEAGAMRLPVQHKLVAEYIKKFNSANIKLVTSRFLNSTSNDRSFIRGDLSKDLHSVMKNFDDRLREHSWWNEMQQKAESGTLEGTKCVDQFSLWDALRQMEWSDEDVESYVLHNNIESLLSTSLLENFRDDLLLRSGESFVQVDGGMDKLPNAFLPSLAPVIRFGARVRRLEWRGREVTIYYTAGSKKLRRSAAAVVMAVPFPILRHINFDPPLSIGMRRAIRRLHYDSSTKIFLQFRERFWEKRSREPGGSMVTDLPIRKIYYPSGGRDDGRGVLLASYTWGADAERWRSLPETARINEALRQVAVAHDDCVDRHRVRRLFEVGASKSWYDDPFAGGAFALYMPGQHELHEIIVKPDWDGAIYFAGEHTTATHAWIEGAIESGLRVAEQINER